jgi:hypothetical protein
VLIDTGANGATESLNFIVPANAVTGSSFGVRFRLTSTQSPGSTGASGTGEVEDYVTTLLAPTTDFGDWSGTAAASNGVVTGLRLGASVDTEFAATSNSAATGDDITGTDDEDGVTLPAVTAGQTVGVPIVVTNTTGAGAFLNAWIDLNNNGSFTDSGENIIVNLPVNNGQTNQTINPSVTIPPTATTGVNLGVRFRLTSITTPGATGTGGGLGEVEDYQINIAAPTTDLGDYSGLSGASSTASTSLRMGASVDTEFTAILNGLATGDDNVGIDDEDGVTLQPMRAGDPVTITVAVNNTTASVAYLNGWIDYNNDGTLNNTDEQIATNVIIPSGTSALQDVMFNVAPEAVSNMPLGVRFRLTSTSTPGATGHSGVGEVEDYVVTIAPPPLDFGDWSGLSDASSSADPGLRLGALTDTEFTSDPDCQCGR